MWLLHYNLFAVNKEPHSTHMEIVEYPKHKVNHHTGATEFTVTIQGDDLTYLDWKPTWLPELPITAEHGSVMFACLTEQVLQRYLVKPGPLN